MKNKVFMPLVVFLTVIPPGSGFAQESAVRWWEGYQGTDATGDRVLGFWKFDGDAATFADDSSSHDHPAVARGAVWHSAGRFGGCLESSAGYPVADQSHGLHVAKSPVLSPTGAFTVEMWIRPKSPDQFPATMQPVLLDMKYVPGNHTGFMLSLTRASGDGRRRLAVEIGCGNESHHWYSDPLTLSEDHWQHIAFTYDRQGTVAFFVDGSDAGRSTQPAAGPMAAAARPLSIGDRIGSLYRGFPGYIDEVRLTRGIREFRPVGFTPDLQRFVFVRMSDNAEITAELINQTGAPLSDVTLSLSLPDDIVRQVSIPDLAAAEHFPVRVNLNTSLKPGSYAVVLTVNLPDWAGMKSGYQSTTRIPFVITRRLPPRMPVVMWGIGGTDGVVREIPRLKQIGFTHCLGLRADYQKIWDEKATALPAAAAAVREGREMLNVALEHDLQIVASLSPGRWLRTAAAGKPFLRVDRDGRHYQREDISGLFPAVQDFCFDTGAAMGRAYGDHPAFAAALLHTEVRGESQVSFHQLEIDAFRQATGAEIPPEVSSKNGVQYQRLKNFPDNRVIADDHPILQYLQWFWTEGDGWNQLNTRLHEGLQQQTRPGAFWTFHDPAARVPSIRGSGGQADVLAHWTYTYPDPVRIGLCTDELFEMARVNGHDQNVMKMTQLIWYRSQTAPKRAAAEADPSPWVDQDPDADYITIAPMHLREAFWWKIARPIKGIMYHGWQSLVESDSPGAYRYTNPNTRHELQRLIEDVVVPLGPTLLEIP
ncbi:MAG: LamG domain-containing protein, partial [Fuerstiella sp.]